MEINKIIDIFNLSPTKMISHTDMEKWKNLLMDYVNYNEEEVSKAYQEVINYAGPDKDGLYYLTAVRRRIQDMNNSKWKNTQMPQPIRNLFKNQYAYNQKKT